MAKHLPLDPTVKVLVEATTAMKSMAERQGTNGSCGKYVGPMQTAVNVAIGITSNIKQQVQTQSASIPKPVKVSQIGGTAFNKGAVGSTVGATSSADNSSGSTSESTSRGPGQR